MAARRQAGAGRADGPPLPELELVQEAKVADLLGDPAARLEASGVLGKDGWFYVIFDNAPQVARLDAALSPQGDNRLLAQADGDGTGYEDIAYDRAGDRFFTLIEALPRGGRNFMAKVRAFDGSFRASGGGWLDFPLDRPNKGLEGLTCLQQAGRTLLLGLCEGNRCKAGAAGRRPGGGRIQVFSEGARHWDHVGTIRLPEAVRFEDYSSLAVAGDRLAVVSQASSALWVGGFRPGSLDLAGDGTNYRFPRDGDGRVVYCTVEGVSWAAPDRVVVVSDRAKAGTQARRCRAKDQSIHVFRLPAAP